MKYFSILLFFLYPLLTMGQEIIHFKDTIYFQVLEREDTLDINGSFPTPYPNTLKLDLNCDGEKDITFNGYTTPIQNFPSAHHIVIQNLLGSDLEFLKDGGYLNAFRMDDEINLDSIDGWASLDSFRLFYFNVFGGAHWAGVKSTDSTAIHNMYLLFRLKENNEYRYGWIYYSGFSWPTKLFVHKIAFSRIACLQTSIIGEVFKESEISISPNPFENNVHIYIPYLNHKKLEWRILNVNGVLELEGEISDRNTELDLGKLIDGNGVYLIQIVMEDKIYKSQILVKI
ncbi:MAG: T9SS type A sorting domain-containing protein [Saprospiraceae bacterium]|nr:T9SS type A sorting domain-containing protein [Saprospiraceae bacterium]